MACDYETEYRCGDGEHNLLKKILGRLKEIVGLGAGGDTVTLTVSDIEIGAVEIKDGDTDTRAKVITTCPLDSDRGLVVRNIPCGTQAVSGPLTDAQLRATRVPVELPPGGSGLTDAELRATPVPVSGPLTDAQLRASAVPTRLQDGVGAALATVINSDPIAGDNGLVVRNLPSGIQSVDGSSFTQPVSGSFLTDAQLRASPVSTSDANWTTDGSAFAMESSKIAPGGYVFDEVAGVSLAENDVAAARIDAKRAQVFVFEDSTTRGQRATVSAAGAVKVDGSAVTQPISAGSLPLPAGAATETTLDAIRDTLDLQLDVQLSSRLSEATFTARTPTLGQKTMAGSSPIVIASDQSAVPVSGPLTDAQLRASTVLVADDWRRNSTPKRYQISVILTPANATALTNLMGLRKQGANADAYLIRIRVTTHHSAAGVAFTFGWKRATTVAGGTLVAAADVPKMDTAAANASLEIRTGAVTFGAEAAQYLLSGPSAVAAAPAAGTGAGIDWEWLANDRAGSVRLTGDEGLIMEQVTASDVDNRVYVTVEWEEV